MLLMAETSTISSWVTPNHQIQTQRKHHKNIRFQLLPPRIFTTISRIPATDYNANISRFCETGNLQTAINSIPKSEESKLNSETYSKLLQLCAESKSLHHGKQIHSLISSSGIDLDSAICSKLVFMYVSCGDVEQGKRVFDNMEVEFKRNALFLWNFMMNSYSKMGFYEESLSLFKEMIEIGVEPDSYSFSCVFKCLATIGNGNLGGMIHGYALKLGFGFDTIVVNSMIAYYFKNGDIDSAHKVFDNFPDRDVVTWNTMISGFVSNGFAQKGFRVFRAMICCEISPDLATIVSVVIACANIGDVSLGRMVHGYAVKRGFGKKTRFSNTLLDMYSKCGDVDSGFRVFENTDERCIVSWTSMIAGYVRNRESKKAISLFLEMKNEGFKPKLKPDTFVITSILHACALNGSLEIGKEVHNYIRENHIQSLAVSNALMDMYAKCGNMDESYAVFSDTRFKDIVSWNTIIAGFSKNRLPNEALAVFVKMQREFSPDNVTITCILPVCASLGLLKNGREIHGRVLRNGLISDQYVVNALIDMYVKCGVKCSSGGLVKAKSLLSPKLEHYAFMANLLLRDGKLNEAFEFVNGMSLKPDAAIWASLLSGCRVHRDVKLAEKVAEKIFEIEPGNTEYYVVMASIYSEAEKWEEMKRLRSRNRISNGNRSNVR